MRLLAPYVRVYFLGDRRKRNKKDPDKDPNTEEKEKQDAAKEEPAPIEGEPEYSYKFESGDGWLRSASIELGEDARASTCQIEIFDPDLRIGAELFEMSFKDGGIQVPAELLSDPNQQQAGGGVAGGSGAGFGPPNGQGGPAITSRPTGSSKEAQASYYEQAYSTLQYDPEYQQKVDQFAQQALANKARYQAVVAGTNVPWEFVAATHYRESTFAFDKHLHNGDPLNQVTTRVPAGRGPFSTWEESARDAMFGLKGLDKESDWSVAGTAYQLERYNGFGYANKGRPSPYLWAGSQHYQGGKYVADGRYDAGTKDQQVGTMTLIARIRQIEGGGGTPPPSAPEDTAADGNKQEGEQPSTEGGQLATKEKPTESPDNTKGTEMVVQLGFGGPDQAISYHFIHMGTDVAGMGMPTTGIKGQSIRWLMTRRRKNSAYKDLSLREVAEQVCRNYGLKLEMEGDGPKYAHLDQTGISDYEMLLRECRAIGYRMAEDNGTLKIGPWRPKFTGFVITPAILDQIQFSDKAQSELQGGGTKESKESSSDRTSGDRKQQVNRLTGDRQQTAAEDTTGAGRDPVAVTGAATPEPHGNIAPTHTARQTAAATAGQAIAQAAAAGGTQGAVQTKPGSSNPDAKDGEKLEDKDGKPKEDEDKPATQTASQADAFEAIRAGRLPDESVTGLPTQETGSLDLADGVARGQELKDESRRTKGYESSVTFKTTPEALTIAPGSVIAIAQECFKNETAQKVFGSEWRVGKVRHDFGSGGPKTTLDIYKPLAQKPPPPPPSTTGGAAGATTGATAGGPGIGANGQRLQNPCPGVRVNSKFCPPHRPRHFGVDQAAPLGTKIYAAGAGTVTLANLNFNPTGYGAAVYIDHGTTYGKHYGTRYGHVQAIHVKQGDTVEQGQHICDMGTKGHSTGSHLHFEVRIGGPSGTAVNPETECANY